jgi:glycine cleavage system regulatory protein
MAQNNGLPEHIIHGLRKKLTTRIDRTKQTQDTQRQSKKWVTFTYYTSLVHKITNLFKRTDINIAFRPTNTILRDLPDIT